MPLDQEAAPSNHALWQQRPHKRTLSRQEALTTEYRRRPNDAVPPAAGRRLVFWLRLWPSRQRWRETKEGTQPGKMSREADRRTNGWAVAGIALPLFHLHPL